jgi:hypothetical protein
MTRRGSLEWSLETVAKLALYALILVGIVYMSLRIVDLFVAGEKEWRAKRNFEMLVHATREVVPKSSILPGKGDAPKAVGSAVIHVSNMHFIGGFDKDSEGFEIEIDKTLCGALSVCDDPKQRIEQPKECDKQACLCMMRIVVDQAEAADGSSEKKLGVKVLDCEKYDVDAIVTPWKETVLFSADPPVLPRADQEIDIAPRPEKVDGKDVYDVIFTEHMGPRLIEVRIINGTLILTPVCTDEEWQEDHSCKAGPVSDLYKPLDCSRNPEVSLERQFCHQKTGSRIGRLTGRRENNGVEQCYACEQVGSRDGALCAYEQIQCPTVKENAQNYAITKKSCDAPKPGQAQNVMPNVVGWCNAYLANPVQYDAEFGRFVTGRDTEGNCWRCSIERDPADAQKTMCAIERWPACDHDLGLEQVMVPASCDSPNMHPDYAAQCVDRNTQACVNAEQSHIAAKRDCPPGFSQSGVVLEENAQEAQTTFLKRYSDGDHCVKCTAKRDLALPAMTSCKIEFVLSC